MKQNQAFKPNAGRFRQRETGRSNRAAPFRLCRCRRSPATVIHPTSFRCKPSLLGRCFASAQETVPSPAFGNGGIDRSDRLRRKRFIMPKTSSWWRAAGRLRLWDDSKRPCSSLGAPVSRRALHRRRNAPNLSRVFRDGPVAGKVAGVGDVDGAHPPPARRIAVRVFHLLMRFGVGGKVAQHKIFIILRQKRIVNRFKVIAGIREKAVDKLVDDLLDPLVVRGRRWPFVQSAPNRRGSIPTARDKTVR